MQEQINSEDNAQQIQLITQSIIQSINILSLTCPTKQQLQKAHNLVCQQSKNINTLTICIKLLKDKQLVNNSKSIVTTIIDNFIKFQTTISNFQKKHDGWKIHILLYDALLSSQIQGKFKEIIQKSYIRLIHYDRSVAIRKDLTNKIVSFFNEKSNLQDNQSMKSICYVIRALIHGKIETDSMSELINNLMNILNKWLIDNAKIIIQSLKDKNQQKFIQRIQIYSLCLQTYKLLFIKTDPQRFPTFKLQLISKFDFTTLILLIFQFKLPDSEPTLMIDTRGLEPLKYLNIMKRNCLEMLCNVFRILHKKKNWYENDSYKNIIIVSTALMKAFPNLILKQVVNYPKIDIPDKDLLKQAMRFMTHVVQTRCFYSLAQEYLETILYKICLQCLVTTDEDNNRSPQDYKNYRQDIANAQQANSLQNCVSKLIQAYCDNIDGSMIKLVIMVINLIEFQLTANPKFFECLPLSLTSSNFYNQIQFQQQIIVCLMVLTIVSYRAQFRADLSQKVQGLLIRRQQYIFNIQLNHKVRLAFLLCYSYYVDNFYKLIISQSSDQPSFHYTFLMNLIKIIVIFTNSQGHQSQKISVLQAYDCIENCITQKDFIQALFTQEQAQKELIQFFQKLLDQWNTQYNLIIADIIIEFLKQKLRAHLRQGKYSIHSVIRQKLTVTIAIKITQFYQKIQVNKNIINSKMYQLLKLILIMVNNPITIYQINRQLILLFKNKSDYSLEILQCVEIIMKYIIQQYSINQINRYKKIQQLGQNNINYNNNNNYLKNIAYQLGSIIISGFQIIQTQKRFGPMFGIIQYFIQIDCLIFQFLGTLATLLFSNPDLLLQQHSAYLILEIAYKRYTSINNEHWLQVVAACLNYLQKDHIRQGQHLYGKLLCILLCCFQSNYLFWCSVYNTNTMKQIWKLLLANEKKYYTLTQQKIFVIKIIQFINHYQIDNLDEIFRIIVAITYYAHNGQSLNWNHDDGNSNQQSSQQQDNQKQYWEIISQKINKNQFLNNLPDQVALLRNLFISCLQIKNQWFVKFVQNLPIALKNFVKNRVINYQQTNKSSFLRKIYKVKRISQ